MVSATKSLTGPAILVLGCLAGTRIGVDRYVGPGFLIAKMLIVIERLPVRAGHQFLADRESAAFLPILRGRSPGDGQPRAPLTLYLIYFRWNALVEVETS
jgi:hypothetical protein